MKPATVPSRAWPRHADGRPKMVSELTPAEFALQHSTVVERVIASAPAKVRGAAYETAEAAQFVRSAAVLIMILRNATLAARAKVQP